MIGHLGDIFKIREKLVFQTCFLMANWLKFLEILSLQHLLFYLRALFYISPASARGNNNITERIRKSIHTSKSPGPDGLHPKVLREIAAQIANPLCIMFRASLKTGIIPDTWKMAHVTPVYKKGKKDQKESYRPLSLTSVFSSLYFKLVNNT